MRTYAIINQLACTQDGEFVMENVVEIATDLLVRQLYADMKEEGMISCSDPVTEVGELVEHTTEDGHLFYLREIRVSCEAQ